MIYDLKRSVDLRWLFDLVLYSSWSCFLLISPVRLCSVYVSLYIFNSSSFTLINRPGQFYTLYHLHLHLWGVDFCLHWLYECCLVCIFFMIIMMVFYLLSIIIYFHKMCKSCLLYTAKTSVCAYAYIWVICYGWGNSSILEGRFSKWF